MTRNSVPFLLARHSSRARRVLAAAAIVAAAACAGDAPTSPDGAPPPTALASHSGDDMGDPGRPSKVHDAKGDFLATYVGPHNRDLDVRKVEVSYDGESFVLEAKLDGELGETAGATYVLGVNRGAGTARFAAIGLTGVLFDWVLAISLGGTTAVRELTACGGATPLTAVIPASAISVNGSKLEVRVPASLLPSCGVAPEDYTVNFWPRLPGTNAQLADFAPDNSMAPVR